MTLSSARIRLLAAFAALNLLLAVGGWVALVGPQRHNAATDAAQAQLALDQLQALTGQTHSPGKQPAIHTSCLYKLNTALPSQEDQPGLLIELDRLAKATGVSVVGISPQAAQATATGYTIQPVNLQLSGTYFQLTSYLRSLRTLVSRGHGCPSAKGPLFAVQSASYASSTGHALTATVGVNAFYYGVTGGATPPASTTDTSTTTTTGG